MYTFYHVFHIVNIDFAPFIAATPSTNYYFTVSCNSRDHISYIGGVISSGKNYLIPNKILFLFIISFNNILIVVLR